MIGFPKFLHPKTHRQYFRTMSWIFFFPLPGSWVWTQGHVLVWQTFYHLMYTSSLSWLLMLSLEKCGHWLYLLDGFFSFWPQKTRSVVFFPLSCDICWMLGRGSNDEFTPLRTISSLKGGIKIVTRSEEGERVISTLWLGVLEWVGSHPYLWTLSPS